MTGPCQEEYFFCSHRRPSFPIGLHAFPRNSCRTPWSFMQGFPRSCVTLRGELPPHGAPCGGAPWTSSTYMELRGLSMKSPWGSTEVLNGVPWRSSMVLHGVIHRATWTCMELRELRGAPWSSMNCLWSSVEVHVESSIELHGAS